jgi:phage protein D
MPNQQGLLSQLKYEMDGKDAPSALVPDILRTEVETSLHLPDVATMVIHDRHVKWVDDPLLWPGKTLKLSAQFMGVTAIIFEGEIVELEPAYLEGSMQLTVRAFDRLHRLSRGRRARSFLNVKDEDLVKQIAGEVGLEAKSDSTREVTDYVFQDNESNLEFLQRRAEFQGFLVFVTGKTLHFERPKPSEALELAWHEQLSEFKPCLSSIHQPSEFVVRGWDIKNKRAVVGTAKKGESTPKIGEGRSGGEVAQDAFHLEAPWLIAASPVRKQAVAEQMAQAAAHAVSGEFITAEGTCTGNPKLKAGVKVKLKGLGKRFSGEYVVTGATHHFAGDSGYFVTFNVSGHHASTLLSSLRDKREGGRFDGGGLVIGVVTNNDDPDGKGRVKVKYPWLSEDHEGDWARLVSIGAGKDRGIEFIPEVNDEVLIGFELGDIHAPYVLGGLWNGQDAPPVPTSTAVSGGKVVSRVIRSRLGHEIRFLDGDEPQVRIKTKAGHTILLDEKPGAAKILIADKTEKNFLQIDSEQNELTIELVGDVTIKAGGNMTLKAGVDMKIEAMANLDLLGAVSSFEGQASAALKAPQVDVKGSAMVNVTGALVKIN